MNAERQRKPRPRTLADMYEDRPLSQQQVRRLVYLLGLATTERTCGTGDRNAA
jgi:hypothetical protein